MHNNHIEAKYEIDESLYLNNIYLKFLGLTFDDQERPYTLLYILAMLTIYLHTLSDIFYMYFLLRDDPKLERIVHYLHMVGYGYLCLTRLYILGRKRRVFGRLLNELVLIWPTQPMAAEATHLKRTMLETLRVRHIWYSIMTFGTLVIFALTPLTVYGYSSWLKGEQAEVGFLWAMWYPFDKHHPVAHVFVYIFEIYVGFICGLVNVTSDIWFTAMTNHICILLRMLHMRLRALGEHDHHQDSFKQIIYNIKVHKTLISYCNNLEDAFTTVNFNNVLLSSINTCCAIFSVFLIDPLFALGNKLFLGAYLVQTFLLCWYCDEIYYANSEVAEAAYESNWYNLDGRCRRLLLLLIYRSQKPLGFTALKFTTITLKTYYTIVSRSYSYFAVLHTMYKRNKSI